MRVCHNKLAVQLRSRLGFALALCVALLVAIPLSLRAFKRPKACAAQRPSEMQGETRPNIYRPAPAASSCGCYGPDGDLPNHVLAASMPLVWLPPWQDSFPAKPVMGAPLSHFLPSNLTCFRDSVQERTTYLRPDLIYSCFAPVLCVSQSGSVPEFLVPATPGARSAEFPQALHQLTRRNAYTLDTYDPAYGHPFPMNDQAEFTVFAERFFPWNAYHMMHEFFAPLFEALYAARGSRFYSVPSGVRNDVRFFQLEAAQNTPFDPLFVPFFSPTPFSPLPAHVNFCVRNAWVGVPFFARPDERFEKEFPRIGAPPLALRMVFVRELAAHVLRQVAQDPTLLQSLVATGLMHAADVMRTRLASFGQRVTTLQNAAACGFVCPLFRQAHSMAQLERSTFWTATTAPVGTFVLYIRRTSGRLVLNEDELVNVLSTELNYRGYPFVAVDMEKLPLHAQVLYAARATVMIGPHGAGLSYAAFMHAEGSSVIEMQSQANDRKFFAMVASEHNLHYFSYQSSAHDCHLPEGETEPANADYLVHPRAVFGLVKQAIWLSDQSFGTPAGHVRPVTKSEAWPLQ